MNLEMKIARQESIYCVSNGYWGEDKEDQGCFVVLVMSLVGN